MTHHDKPWGTRFKLAAVSLMLLGLAACATPFKADVSRFTSQLPAPQGQTFAVVADDPALAGGLEFSLYAKGVEAELQKLGYTPAPPEQADLLVRFDYGVGNGRERVRDTGYFGSRFYDPWYGYSAFGYPRFHGAWGYGFYDPWIHRPRIESYTVYTSDISLKIDNSKTGERLFEGRAEALSTSDRLQYLVPNLVDAMFTDFPGRSGETVRITIAPEDMKVARKSGY